MSHHRYHRHGLSRVEKLQLLGMILLGVAVVLLGIYIAVITSRYEWMLD
jgi:hypothetical protein